MDGRANMGQVRIAEEVAIQPYPAANFRNGNIIQLALERHSARNGMGTKISLAHMSVNLAGNVVGLHIPSRSVDVCRTRQTLERHISMSGGDAGDSALGDFDGQIGVAIAGIAGSQSYASAIHH